MALLAKKTTANQFGIMIAFFEKYPYLINKGNDNFSKSDIQSKWQELAEILNAEPNGPSKNVDTWKKTWRDYKFCVKKKAAKFAHYKKRNEGGPIPNMLSPIEERVLTLFDDVTSNGDEETDSQVHIKNCDPMLPPEILYGTTVVNLNMSFEKNKDISSGIKNGKTSTEPQIIKNLFEDQDSIEQEHIQIDDSREQKYKILEQTSLYRQKLKLYERKVVASERKAAAMERKAAAMERQANAVERQLT
ncbi:hypothetical protein X975_01463, partial [Stegodyphus mimosarum]